LVDHFGDALDELGQRRPYPAELIDILKHLRESRWRACRELGNIRLAVGCHMYVSTRFWRRIRKCYRSQDLRRGGSDGALSVLAHRVGEDIGVVDEIVRTSARRFRRQRSSAGGFYDVLAAPGGRQRGGPWPTEVEVVNSVISEAIEWTRFLESVCNGPAAAEEIRALRSWYVDVLRWAANVRS
jgi:hypothetical protein